MDGDFGVDDGVDDEVGGVGGGGQGGGGPGGPLGIFGHHIEQHVAVDEDGRHSIAPGEGHDFLGGHAAGAAAAQVGDEFGAAAGLAGGGDGDEANGGAVVFEGDLGVGHQAGALADVGGDGDLAFGGDAHGGLRFLTGERKTLEVGRQGRQYCGACCALRIKRIVACDGVRMG